MVAAPPGGLDVKILQNLNAFMNPPMPNMAAPVDVVLVTPVAERMGDPAGPAVEIGMLEGHALCV
jgi:hypothetical protein